MIQSLCTEITKPTEETVAVVSDALSLQFTAPVLDCLMGCVSASHLLWVSWIAQLSAGNLSQVALKHKRHPYTTPFSNRALRATPS